MRMAKKAFKKDNQCAIEGNMLIEMFMGNIVKNSDGIPEVDNWCYCEYFAENIQKRNGEFMDGLHLYTFADRWEATEDKYKDEFHKFIADENINIYLREMQKKGINVNVFALFTLCYFINTIIHEKKVLLLKPTIEDLAEELEKVSKMTLYSENGKRIDTDNSSLLELVNNRLHEKNDDIKRYYPYKLVDREDIFVRETLQIEFVYYFSAFLNSYFDVKRKNGGLLCVPEQELLCHLLHWFDLSSSVVSPSRFRQLKDDYEFNESIFPFMPIRNDYGVYESIPLIIVKYRDWKCGKGLDPRENPLSEIQKDETLVITKEILSQMIQDYKFFKNED